MQFPTMQLFPYEALRLRSGVVSWKLPCPSIRTVGCVEITPSPRHSIGVGEDANFPLCIWAFSHRCIYVHFTYSFQ